MGNCQAAEAATVVIIHPENKIERIYWSVSANQIMNSNPGHYVAHLVTSLTAKSEDGKPLKQLKLLRPDDTLLIGQVYRLISFEDVLKEFAAKKCVKLGKMIKETGEINGKQKRNKGKRDSKIKVEQEVRRPCSSSSSSNCNDSSLVSSSSTGVMGTSQRYQGGQWKPALQSIAEFGS
ncbi:hypothetical protein AQUCO_06000043v1 [Aquilegia coerulea]|uniref:DUF4228 domain-containing protein n=1 Tax=Aquilegia coerulea TaxID=218851 RepID=A0A2G5CDR7_AQUCA|nr:hypothetical protein AQUCO_06000043v1 [Aquilegia coerulea]